MDELSELFSIEVDEFCKKAKVNIRSTDSNLLIILNKDSIDLSNSNQSRLKFMISRIFNLIDGFDCFHKYFRN